jgi:hypothetical protein
MESTSPGITPKLENRRTMIRWGASSSRPLPGDLSPARSEVLSTAYVVVGIRRSEVLTRGAIGCGEPASRPAKAGFDRWGVEG